MIETIVTIFLITVGIVGLAAGMAATERIAAINQDQAQLEVAMRQLSDWVRDDAALPYVFCEQPSGADYNTAMKQALTPSSGTTFAIKQVLESPITVNGVPVNGLRNGVGTPPQQTCQQQPCPRQMPRPCVGDWGVQEITVEVKDASHSLTRFVWKSASW